MEQTSKWEDATHSDELDLANALIDATVDRRARIALGRRASALGGKVEVDREEALSGRRLPCRDEGLPARVPGRVRRFDPAGVEPVQDVQSGQCLARNVVIE